MSCGRPFEIALGERTEVAQVFRAPNREGLHVFFIDHPGFFDRAGIYGENGTEYPDNPHRFAFFCRAALRIIPAIAPGARVLHTHDWHTALAPVFLRTELAADQRYQRFAAIQSVHNAAFQGVFPLNTAYEIGLTHELLDARKLEWYGQVNLLKGGVEYADAVVTVSPTHSIELRTAEGGFGLHEVFASCGDRMHGVVNGIDTELWNPERDALTPACFSALQLSGKRRCKEVLQRSCGLQVRTGSPLIAMCARLTEQKGIDLLLGALSNLPSDAQFIMLGEGEARFARALSDLAVARPDGIAVDVAFTEAKEHLLLAGADMLLMPSRFEPCGLTQMRASRYGTIPIARRTGGLADTIEDDVTGFLFDEVSASALTIALLRAIAAYGDRTRWTDRMRAGMRRDFRWERSAEHYEQIYRTALRAPRAART